MKDPVSDSLRPHIRPPSRPVHWRIDMVYPSLTAPNRWHFLRGVCDLFDSGERRGRARYRLKPSLHKKLGTAAYLYSKTASSRPIARGSVFGMPSATRSCGAAKVSATRVLNVARPVSFRRRGDLAWSDIGASVNPCYSSSSTSAFPTCWFPWRWIHLKTSRCPAWNHKQLLLSKSAHLKVCRAWLQC